MDYDFAFHLLKLNLYAERHPEPYNKQRSAWGKLRFVSRDDL